MSARTSGSADFIDIHGSHHVFSGDAAQLMADRVVDWLVERC